MSPRAPSSTIGLRSAGGRLSTTNQPRSSSTRPALSFPAPDRPVTTTISSGCTSVVVASRLGGTSVCGPAGPSTPAGPGRGPGSSSPVGASVGTTPPRPPRRAPPPPGRGGPRPADLGGLARTGARGAALGRALGCGRRLHGGLLRRSAVLPVRPVLDRRLRDGGLHRLRRPPADARDGRQFLDRGRAQPLE